MSEQQTDLQLPEVDQAVALQDRLYCERFFNKMASFGFPAQTQEDVVAMLHTAAQLDALPEPESQSPYVDAAEKLAHVLNQYQGQQPNRGQVKVAEDVNERRYIAQALAQNPDFYRSVLSIKSAELQAAAAQSQGG